MSVQTRSRRAGGGGSGRSSSSSSGDGAIDPFYSKTGGKKKRHSSSSSASKGGAALLLAGVAVVSALVTLVIKVDLPAPLSTTVQPPIRGAWKSFQQSEVMSRLLSLSSSSSPVVSSSNNKNSDLAFGEDDDDVEKRRPLFDWGVASSAYQIEGAWNEDGKGPSIWDTFSHTPGKVHNNETGDVACDFYHLYQKDIGMMKSLGAKSFRFSLSWSRLLPKGRGQVNEAGFDFYNRVLDALEAAGIEPHVTLYHWDLPQALQDEYGGWLSPRSVDDFERYAALVFQRLGPRVKHWSTFNEPYTFAFCGHDIGIHAPGRCSDRKQCEKGGDSDVEPWVVSHHVLLAHARAVARFRELFPKHGDGERVRHGQEQKQQERFIGINLNSEWAEPLDPSNKKDVDASQRYLDAQLGIYANPIFGGPTGKGDYPESLKRLVPALPRFTEEQRRQLLGSADYFLLNHYTSRWVEDAPAEGPVGARALTHRPGGASGIAIGPQAASFWLFSVPWGFRKLLKHVSDAYSPRDPSTGEVIKKIEVRVTESGCDGPGEDKAPLPEVLRDEFRVSYFRAYVDAAEKAVLDDGVELASYAAWSILDNFEWREGYSSRFGIVYTDYATLKRHPKDSARWLSRKFASKSKKKASGEEIEEMRAERRRRRSGGGEVA